MVFEKSGETIDFSKLTFMKNSEDIALSTHLYDIIYLNVEQ